MCIQRELFEPVSIWFNPIWSCPHWFVNTHQCEFRKRNPGMALSRTHDSYHVNKEDGFSCEPDPQQHLRLHVLARLCLHFLPLSSHSHNGSSHVVMWRRPCPTTSHSSPVQSGFYPPQQVDWLDAHSIRFGFFTFAVRTRPMRIDADWMRIQCPVQTGLKSLGLGFRSLSLKLKRSL